jgi:hypothetical protein
VSLWRVRGGAREAPFEVTVEAVDHDGAVGKVRGWRGKRRRTILIRDCVLVVPPDEQEEQRRRAVELAERRSI